MHVVLQVVAYAMFLVLAQEALRRTNKWVVWALFLLAPAVLTPYWLSVNDLGAFPYIKGYSVFFCVCWVTALRLTPLGTQPWARAAIPLLLAANILEATAVDALGRGPAHALNAAAGLLLVLLMPYGPDTTRIDTAGRHRDLHYATTRGWVLGYTIWNWTFVYLNYPALTGHHTAVLAAGLIAAGADPRRWTQARALTLG